MFIRTRGKPINDNQADAQIATGSSPRENLQINLVVRAFDAYALPATVSILKLSRKEAKELGQKLLDAASSPSLGPSDPVQS